MPLFQLILVAVIQGITEFLPISSSGHLILLPSLTGMQDQGQLIDVAVHIGTLGAVLLYFRQDVGMAFKGLIPLAKGRVDTPGAALALNLIVSTLPLVLFGAVLYFSGLSETLRSATVIGWTMLIFGIVLYWADRTGQTTKSAPDWTLKEAVIMGAWQALSLIPGTSRSGITITGARRLGYGRTDAARIAMLMSIPAIIASGVLVGSQAFQTADSAALWDCALAIVFSFVSALIALSLMMRILRSVSFTPYVIYRIVLGLALLVWAYS